MLREDLPEGLPVIFISSAAHMNLVELKDLLWKELNRETKHQVESIVYKAMDIQSLKWDDEDFDVPAYDDEEDEGEDYFHYGDEWGAEPEYDTDDSEWLEVEDEEDEIEIEWDEEDEEK